MLFETNLDPKDDDGAVVAATAGFFQIKFRPTVKLASMTSVREQMRLLPIIVWKVSANAHEPITPEIDAEPITAGIATAGTAERATILLPTGVVISPDGYFKNLDDWALATFKRWHVQEKVAFLGLSWKMVKETQKPRGYATLAEALAAIRDYESARRRALTEMPWPPRQDATRGHERDATA